MNSQGDPSNPALDGRLSEWRTELDTVVENLKLPISIHHQTQSLTAHRSPPLRPASTPRSPAVDSYLPVFNPAGSGSPSQIEQRDGAGGVRLEELSEFVKAEVSLANEALRHENQLLRSRLVEAEEENRRTKGDLVDLVETVEELQRRTAVSEQVQESRDEKVVGVQKGIQTVGKWKEEVTRIVETFKREWKSQRKEFADLKRTVSDFMTREEGTKQIAELFAPIEAELKQRLEAQSKMLDEMAVASQVSKSLLSRLNTEPNAVSGESSETDLGLVAEVLRQEIDRKLEVFELRLSEKVASVDKALAWRLIEETKEIDRKLANHSLVVANELNYRDAPNFLQRLQSLEDDARKRRLTEVDYISKSQIRERVDELLAQANLNGVVIPENEQKFVDRSGLEDKVLDILRRNNDASDTAPDKLYERLKSLEDKVSCLADSKDDNGLIAEVKEELKELKDVVSRREEELLGQQKVICDVCWSLKLLLTHFFLKINKSMQNELESLTREMAGSSAKVAELDSNIKTELEKVNGLRASAAKSAQVRDYKLAGLEERVSRLQRTVATSSSSGGQQRPSEAIRKSPTMSVHVPPTRQKSIDESGLSTPKNKSKEQLEKEARRQAELQAVRERLEKFEKKWSEGKVKGSRGKPGGQSPQSTIKPSPPKSLPIPVSAPPAGRPQQIKKDSSISCQYCRRLLPGKNTAALHESMCEKKPLKCKYCSTTVLRAELRAHELECSQKVSTCKYCDEEIKTHLLEKHEAKCDWIPGSCSICGKVIISRDLQKHENMCMQRQKPVVEKWSFEEVAEWVEGVAPDCVSRNKS